MNIQTEQTNENDEESIKKNKKNINNTDDELRDPIMVKIYMYIYIKKTYKDK